MMRATFFLLCVTALIGKSLSDDQNVVTMNGPVMAHPLNFASAAVTALSNAATMITNIICRSDGKLSRTSTRRLADIPNLRHAKPLEDQPEGDMVPSSSGTSQPTYLLADREDDDAPKVAQQEEEPTADPTMQPTNTIEIIPQAATGDESESEADDDEKMGEAEGPTPSPSPSPSAQEVPSEMPSPIPEGPTPSPTSAPSETLDKSAVTNAPTLEAPTPAPTESPTAEGPTPSPSFSPTVAEVTPMPTESPTPEGPTPSPTEKPSRSGNSSGYGRDIPVSDDDEFFTYPVDDSLEEPPSEPTDPVLCPTECPVSCAVPTN